MSILTVKNLTKAFGDKNPFIAVNGISEIPTGNEKLNQSISLSPFDSKKS